MADAGTFPRLPEEKSVTSHQSPSVVWRMTTLPGLRESWPSAWAARRHGRRGRGRRRRLDTGNFVPERVEALKRVIFDRRRRAIGHLAWSYAGVSSGFQITWQASIWATRRPGGARIHLRRVSGLGNNPRIAVTVETAREGVVQGVLRLACICVALRGLLQVLEPTRVSAPRPRWTRR